MREKGLSKFLVGFYPNLFGPWLVQDVSTTEWKTGNSMQLSSTIAAAAVVLGTAVTVGYAQGEAGAGATMQTAQSKVEAREAQRRVALAEHQKRKEDFVRRCTTSQPMTAAQLAECRAAYRKL
jgi:hypothetical protein